MSHRERPAPRGSPVSGSVVEPSALARLLADDESAELAPLDSSEPISDSDDRHRAAVALALRTPDVALVRTSSISDRAAVATAIVDAAGRRGERVLLIDTTAAAEHEHEHVHNRFDDGTTAAYDQLFALAEQHDQLRARRAAGPALAPPPARFASRISGFVARILGRPRTEAGGNEADGPVAVLDRELALVADKWHQAVALLPTDGPPPAAPTRAAVVAARDAWAHRPQSNGHESDHRNGSEPAGPVTARPGDRSLEGDPFDLLVVTGAHAVAEDDLLYAAGRAGRAVLIGEPGLGCFDRLWTRLHCEPWARDAERIVCRLRSVPPGGRVDREPVADRPEIELGIHTPPAGEPELAEVTFPAGTPITAAIEYVFKELGELPVCGVGAARLGLATDGHSTADLGDGIRAVVTTKAGGWTISSIEFDPANWTTEQVADWIRCHAVRPGLGRTVDLTR